MSTKKSNAASVPTGPTQLESNDEQAGDCGERNQYIVLLIVRINFIMKQGLPSPSDPDPAVPALSNDTADSTLATSDMSEVGIEAASKGPEAASLSDPLSSSSSLVDISKKKSHHPVQPVIQFPKSMFGSVRRAFQSR